MIKRLFQNIADYIRETDKLLLLFCTLASLYGCALVFSATRYTGESRQFLVQFLSMLIGIGVAIFISAFDYKDISRGFVVYIILAIGLLGVTYMFGYAPEGSENKAWIELPFGMSLQASEMIKIFFIITFSKHIFSIPKEQINSAKNLLLIAAHGLTPAVLVMALQKDLGTVIIMLVMFLAMAFAAGVRARYFIAGGILTALASPLIWFYGLTEYQRQRFSIITNLEADPLGLGYQQLQGLRAIGSGGMFGYGYLKGPKTQAGGVPKGYNDFIFTAAGEELGMIGCLLVIAALLAIVIRIVYVGIHSRDTQGKIICAGAFGMFAAQAIINLGMCLSVLPVIGVTLPFFSAGGTSLVCLYMSIGLVLSVYKNRNRRRMYLTDN